MSVRRNILRARLLFTREFHHSCLDKNGEAVTSVTPPHLLLPAEHFGEIFVEKHGVMCRKLEEREPINHECNCAWLHSSQNLALIGQEGFSRRLKRNARAYLVNIYGAERIQAFLDSIDWPETVEQLLNV